MTVFFKLTLRTLELEAARTFYRSILGEGALDIVRLHDQAIARGARPHWLGHLHVDDVDRATAAFVSRGATPLGPKWVNQEGMEAAVLRDPGGAIVALAKPAAGARMDALPQVLWYGLNTAEVTRARSYYAELFGWDLRPAVDLGELGVHHPFAWERAGAVVGSMLDIAGRSNVHPHWLFHFRVDSVDRATELVRSAGGAALGPFTLPTGERVAVCDDPQGAAFGLQQAS